MDVKEKIRSFTAQLILLDNVYKKGLLTEKEYKTVREYLIKKNQELIQFKP